MELCVNSEKENEGVCGQRKEEMECEDSEHEG